MPVEWIVVLAAVVAGWIVQAALSYRQAMAFNADARALRRVGTVSVGQGGRRYRGGRAFVAIAADDGVVREAISLRGFTTFARAQRLPALEGLRVNVLRSDRELDGVGGPQRLAARQAAELLTARTTRDLVRVAKPAGAKPARGVAG